MFVLARTKSFVYFLKKIKDFVKIKKNCTLTLSPGESCSKFYSNFQRPDTRELNRIFGSL